MKRILFTIIAMACLPAAPVTAQDGPAAIPGESDTALSPAAAAALEQNRRHFEHLAMLLEQVSDSESAAQLAPQIIAAWDFILHFDTSVFDSEDEEMLAAEAALMVDIVKEQLIRLFDANCFDNAQLKEYFGVFTETELPHSSAETRQPAPDTEMPAQEASSESPLP